MIPNKSNFKFQELTPITGVKPYVLRYWETEFEEICPVTSDSGQKLYARKDVEAILRIKKLLFDDKKSIPEVRAILKSKIEESEEVPSLNPLEFSVQEAKTVVLRALEFVAEIKFKKNW